MNIVHRLILATGGILFGIAGVWDLILIYKSIVFPPKYHQTYKGGDLIPGTYDPNPIIATPDMKWVGKDGYSGSAVHMGITVEGHPENKK